MGDKYVFGERINTYVIKVGNGYYSNSLDAGRFVVSNDVEVAWHFTDLEKAKRHNENINGTIYELSINQVEE